MNEKIALFDMDGSLAHFEKAMREDLKALRAPEEPEIPDNLWDLDQMPHMKRRMRMIKNQPGWWWGLERIEEGFTIMQMAKQVGFDIQILTKGPRSHSIAWKEKVDWCDRFEETKDLPIHIVTHKSIVYGRVLYDDYIEYAEAWLEYRPRGLCIMPVTDVNKDFTHPNVVKWDGENKDEILNALIRAFEREPNSDLSL